MGHLGSYADFTFTLPTLTTHFANQNIQLQPCGPLAAVVCSIATVEHHIFLYPSNGAPRFSTVIIICRLLVVQLREQVCLIYICCVSFSVKSILNVRLSESTDKPNNVSVLELPGDILIVPQVSQLYQTALDISYQ